MSLVLVKVRCTFTYTESLVNWSKFVEFCIFILVCCFDHWELSGELQCSFWPMLYNLLIMWFFDNSSMLKKNSRNCILDQYFGFLNLIPTSFHLSTFWVILICWFSCSLTLLSLLETFQTPWILGMFMNPGLQLRLHLWNRRLLWMKPVPHLAPQPQTQRLPPD